MLREGTPVTLAPKTFDTLAYMVQASARLVTREELMKAIWPDSFVEDANLTVNVSLLRKALGEMEEGGPYIETVPRKGYRFKSIVRTIEAEPLGVVTPAPLILEPSDRGSAKARRPEQGREIKSGFQRADSGGERSLGASTVAQRAAMSDVISLPEPGREVRPEPTQERSLTKSDVPEHWTALQGGQEARIADSVAVPAARPKFWWL
ncbi:MAG TPA: winged helix-turn-helix domain-containing protein, partial [Terriglobia bacterium]|nr:winged helix-turn-helix domain-containing protein [Terriglobia bacterium]